MLLMKIFLDLMNFNRSSRDAFEENAEAIGDANPFDAAADVIQN